jgi:hypothetical protein
MVKTRRKPPTRASEPTKSGRRQPKAGIVHSSVYLSEAVHEALRKIAYEERVKIHDLIMEGVGLTLRKRGYPPIEKLRAMLGANDH